jgi:hypothetical protein
MPDGKTRQRNITSVCITDLYLLIIIFFRFIAKPATALQACESSLTIPSPEAERLSPHTTAKHAQSNFNMKQSVQALTKVCLRIVARWKTTNSAGTMRRLAFF